MRKLVFLLFICLTYLIFRPIIGDVWYSVHDTTSIARAYLLEQTLQSGQVPAIWSSLLSEGRGYPLFHFYAPLMTYASLLVKSITLSYFMGVKAVLIVSSLTGMVGMYLLTRPWGRPAGIISAISFALLPYAALDLYVRGAFSEYLALNLLPWVFYCWQDLLASRRQLIAALITTLFILSHNLIPLITFPFLLVWVLIHHLSNLKWIILPTIITLLLSGFYVLPLLFERHFVLADTIALTTSYANHFVSPSQLWNSTWGFGGSGQGIEDGMSFKVGKIQLILAGLAALAILIKRQKIMLFFVGSALLAAFMATPYSSFIWQSLGFLALVQFPWRFLVLVGFFVSILSGYSLTIILNPFLRSIFVLLVIGGLLYINLKLFAPQITFPADQSIYTSDSYLSTLPSIIPEYHPAWQDTNNSTLEDTTVLPYYYYPTWRVEVEGQPVSTYPSAGGMLAFANPNHSNNYTAVQSHTLLEKISSLISLLTLLALLLYYPYLKYVKT
jgi:hypothetical protein